MASYHEKILAAAKWYLAHNWSVVPVTITTKLEDDEIKKIPHFHGKWKSFQYKKLDLTEVTTAFEGFDGIAIATGQISGITVVDIDTENLPEMTSLPVTYQVKTRRGYQFYYKYDPRVQQSQGVIPFVDIRNDGGLVFAPPTEYLLPDGAAVEYKLINNVQLAGFPTTWYQELLKKAGVTPGQKVHEVSKGVAKGARNQSAASLAGSLLHRYPEKDWDALAWPLFCAWNTTNNPPLEIQELTTIWDSIAAAELRRRAAGDTVGEPQVVEEGEHVTIAIPVVDGLVIFEFEDVEYGSRSIEAIVRCHVELPGAIARHLSSRINILSSSAKESLSRQLKESFGRDKKFPWPLIVSQACELLENSFRQRSQAVHWIEQEPREAPYLLAPFLEEGVANILFGKGGSGKTYIALAMAISLATNEPFLGVEPKRRVNNLFLDYENSEHTWKQRITKLLNGLSIREREQLELCFFYIQSKGTPTHELRAKLIEEIKRHDIGLLIIDSAALACGGEPESAEVTTKLFNSLARLNTTILLIAHETKNNLNVKNKAPFGSVFFYNCARNIWNVDSEQDQGDNFIQVGLFHRKANDDSLAPMKAARIEFKPGEVTILAGDTSLWSKEKSLKEQLLEALEEGGMAIGAIVELVAKDIAQVRPRLAELKREGKVINPQRGIWALPDQYIIP